MCSPIEHHHIFVPPPFEDIEDEECLVPFPPPTSPVSVPFPGKHMRTSSASAHNMASEEDGRVGGLLLNQMEEKPMAKRNEPCAALDMEKLLSENGILALCNVFGDISFKGQGHEAEDLCALLAGFQRWGEQIFPHHTFEDLVTHFEEMGDRTEIQTCLRGIQPSFVWTCDQDDYVGCEDSGGIIGNVVKSGSSEEEEPFT